VLVSEAFGGKLRLEMPEVYGDNLTSPALTAGYAVVGDETSSYQTNTVEPDAYQIITKALAAKQNKIHLPAGNYSVSQPIVVLNRPNVEIYGDGEYSTILRLDDNVIQTMLSFSAANNFHVHDLQLDGNRLNQSYTPPYPKYGGPVNIGGISAWNSTNGLIENCFIHDVRALSIVYSLCDGGIIQNNYVENSDANGISVNNQNGGSGTLVQGNLVNGASDVGITGWDAVDLTVTKNTVQNVTMNTSPYEQNSHTGLSAEGAGNATGSKNCTYSENTITNCPYGMYSAPANGNNSPLNQNRSIVFENNTISNCLSAITVNHNVGFTCKSNIMKSFPNGAEWAIKILNDASSLDLEYNTIEGLPTSLQGYPNAIIQLYPPSGKFINNTIYANKNKVLYVKNPAGWITTPNTIE